MSIAQRSYRLGLIARSASHFWSGCGPTEEPKMKDRDNFQMSRREVLVGTAASVAATSVVSKGHAEDAAGAVPAAAAGAPSMVNVSLQVNGNSSDLHLDTRTTLLDALREHLHL